MDQLSDEVTDPERRVYLAMLSAIDQSISQVVETLKQVGMYENTLIIFTTDNGGSVSHAGSNYPLRLIIFYVYLWMFQFLCSNLMKTKDNLTIF